jgi:hypothetical protein
LALWLLPAVAAGVLAGPPRAGDGSYLWTAVRGADGRTQLGLEPYVPGAGDIIFYSDDSVVWRWLYALAGTGPPYHVGIVVRLPDSRPAVLEAGPYDTTHVYLLDVLPRLHTHDGAVWVRRLRAPLGPDQSDRLTCFALAQAGKRFALGRVALQITPVRARGPLRTHLIGRPRPDRRRWFCSELVVAAAGAAGLVDLRAVRPSSVYPRDLFVDSPHDYRPLWEAPARWTAGPSGRCR